MKCKNPFKVCENKAKYDWCRSCITEPIYEWHKLHPSRKGYNWLKNGLPLDWKEPRYRRNSV